MTNYNAAPPDEQVKKLLEHNLAYSKQIYLMTKKIKSYLLFGRIMSLIKAVLIVVFLILGVIYLPPLARGYINNVFPGVLGGSTEAPAKGWQNILQGGDLNQADLQKMIQDNGGAINSYKNILDLYNSQ